METYEKQTDILRFLKPPFNLMGGENSLDGFPHFLTEPIPVAKLGGTEAQFEIGLMYYLQPRNLFNNRESVKWFQLSADTGSVDARFLLKVIRFLHGPANGTG